MTEKDIEKWWDEASEYYQKEISGDKLDAVHYGPFGSTEEKLRLLGNVKGKTVLELGCGGGQCAISLARKGAVCTGIDISKKQLEYAEKLAKKNSVSIKFFKRSFSDLKSFRTASYDIIISVFALQYAKDLGSVLKGAKRLLKNDGILVFSLDHPFYLLMDPNSLTLTENYNGTGMYKEKETWPNGSKHEFIMYRRRISDIVGAINESGLRFERMIEPFDPKDKVWGQGYRRKLVGMITPTIIFKCVKG